MRYGTVVQYFPDKGYGFIRPDLGPHVFFHFTALGGPGAPPQIRLGQPVRFELAPAAEEPARRAPRLGKTDAAGAASRLRAVARVVELIDKIPGGTLEDVARQQRPARHPRARRKKPTWRR